MRRAGKHRGRAAWALAILTGAIGACATNNGGFWAGITGGTTALRIESKDRDTLMTPAYATAVYRAIDENTADFYLSDIEEDQIVEWLRSRGVNGGTGASGGNAGGIVTHIRLFLAPVAGKTPIDYTASNTTITHIVLTGAGEVGVYGGGGFLLPEGAIGAGMFGGKIKGASLKLLRSDDGFADLLGLAEMSGSVGARRDDTLADTIAARLTLMMKR